MNKKITLAIIALLLILVLSLINFASAAIDTSLWCTKTFYEGDRINFCGSVPDRVVDTTSQDYCVDYNSINKCYNSHKLTSCSKACEDNGGTGGTGGVDTTPLKITINSPLPTNGSIFQKRKVELKIALNKNAKVEYEDTVSGRGRRSTLCSSCSRVLTYVTLKEGENRRRIWATDKWGNINYTDLVIYIDSQKPKIVTFGPKDGFANGNFFIQYRESNLKSITLTYGNNLAGFQTTSLQGCASSSQKESCEVDVNLTKYNNQEIEYYFTITDIAGNVLSSKKTKLNVDSAFPQINSLTFSINKKKVLFTIDLNETNLDEITYIDNADLRQTEKRLCTKLIGGICRKDASFSLGDHNLTFYIMDKAGNGITKDVRFTIV